MTDQAYSVLFYGFVAAFDAEIYASAGLAEYLGDGSHRLIFVQVEAYDLGVFFIANGLEGYLLSGISISNYCGLSNPQSPVGILSSQRQTFKRK